MWCCPELVELKYPTVLTNYLNNCLKNVCYKRLKKEKVTERQLGFDGETWETSIGVIFRLECFERIRRLLGLAKVNTVGKLDQLGNYQVLRRVI